MRIQTRQTRRGLAGEAVSNVNIRRAVENIRANTTVYTPLVEVIVNAIQAIDAKPDGARKIQIQAIRDPQSDMYGDVLPEIHSFRVEDTGIGFTDDHRESFDTVSCCSWRPTALSRKHPQRGRYPDRRRSQQARYRSKERR